MPAEEDLRAASARARLADEQEDQGPVTVLSVSWKLSSREREVLSHCGEGQRNKQIAAVMNCSTKTVETYWRRIFIKSGYSTKEEILAALLRIAIAQRRDGSALRPAGAPPVSAPADARLPDNQPQESARP